MYNIGDVKWNAAIHLKQNWHSVQQAYSVQVQNEVCGTTHSLSHPEGVKSGPLVQTVALWLAQTSVSAEMEQNAHLTNVHLHYRNSD